MLNKINQVEAAKIIGCDKSAVSRHMSNHVTAKVVRVADEVAKREALNVVNALETSHENLLKIFNDALADGDRKSALAAIDAETRQLSLIAKVTGQLNAAPQVNFLLNPQFLEIKRVIVEKLMPYPEARVALSEALDSMISEDSEDEETQHEVQG
jgi:predicted transcriptional regulator